jgi:Fe-Mn family superoxide dismutase
MNKRNFLRTGLFVAAASLLKPRNLWAESALENDLDLPGEEQTGPFSLAPLPFANDALEPHFDKMTMEIHHDRHHNAYVTNLNDGVKGTVYADYELADIIARISTSDADKKIRNNAGGHWNHTFFWESMAPGAGGAPTGALAAAIDSTFGGYDKFKEQFSTAAKGVFGSGWAWLCIGADKKLFISSTPNQDNPLMINVVKQTGTPLLGLDVWEHAYYLKFQNKRPDYITAFFNVIDWKKVGERYAKG